MRFPLISIAVSAMIKKNNRGFMDAGRVDPLFGAGN